jgi:hypothetical protein
MLSTKTLYTPIQTITNAFSTTTTKSTLHTALNLGPCIPNFRVEFRVGTSRVSSRNESGRVRKKLEKLVPTLIFEKRLVPTLIFAIFFAKIRVGTSSEGSKYFRNISKFEKRQFPKLAKTKILEKNV